MTWSLFFSVLGGIAAWFVTHFIGRPLLKAYEYREKAHELIFYTGNIGEMTLKDDRKMFEEAVKELRRLAAQIGALAASMPFFYNRLLGYFDYQPCCRSKRAHGSFEFARDQGRVERHPPQSGRDRA
jgi:hypothetical protein